MPWFGFVREGTEIVNRSTRTLDDALERIEQESAKPKTDGKWLEQVSKEISTEIRDWNLRECLEWKEWCARKGIASAAPGIEPGIDWVGIDADGREIAVQCKSKSTAQGSPKLVKSDLREFNIITQDHGEFAERWLITTAQDYSQPLKVLLATGSDFPKLKCIQADVQYELSRRVNDRVSRNAMQNEAIEQCVAGLEKARDRARNNGWNEGEGRGKLILPCATGKTRIAAEVIARMTGKGELAVFLCPSIGLVAQTVQVLADLNREAGRSVRIAAVCSDRTAIPKGIREGAGGASRDPTIDTSWVQASAVSGVVLGSAGEVSSWLRSGGHESAFDLLVGTYQSGHHIADAMKAAQRGAKITVCDEAHRTAGIRVQTKDVEIKKRVGRFTLCHDAGEWPSRYRLYQTATPRIYGEEKKRESKDAEWIVHSMDDEKTFGLDLFRRTYADAVDNGWLCDYRIVAIAVRENDARRLAERHAMLELAGDSGTGGGESLQNKHLQRNNAYKASPWRWRWRAGCTTRAGVPSRSGRASASCFEWRDQKKWQSSWSMRKSKSS